MEDQLFGDSTNFPGGKFGSSVDIVGEWALIGAPLENSSEGAAYLFRRNPDSTWSLFRKITPNGGIANDQFGHAVKLAGNYAMIGAPYDDTTAPNAGAVYFVDLLNNTQSKLASPGNTGDLFGFSVDLLLGESNTLALAMIGAPNHDYFDLGSGTTTTDSGAVYFFTFSPSPPTWNLELLLSPDNRTMNAWAGYDVALAPNGQEILALIGAPFDTSAGSGKGAAYLFGRTAAGSTGIWTQKRFWNASDGNSAELGKSVALNSNYALIGAGQADIQSNNDGAAYLYEKDQQTGVWPSSSNATLQGNGDLGDQYGISVDVLDTGGGTAMAVVGAHYADSRDTSSGEAFLHIRDASGTWTKQQATAVSTELFPIYGTRSQQFGSAIALDETGSRLIVGMPADNSDNGQAQIFDLTRTCSGFLGRVTVEPAVAGVQNTVKTYCVDPGQVVDFLWSLQPGNGMYNGCLTGLNIPAPIVTGIADNGFQEALSQASAPATISGLTIWVQAVDVATCVVSDPVSVTFQ